MGKYDPLRAFLEDHGQPLVKLSFAEIERILGTSLPESARKYPAWWENERDVTHGHAESWLLAGYETRRLDSNAGTVEFSITRRTSMGGA